MSHCPYCATDLNLNATICPSCGADVRPQTWALPPQTVLSKYRLERVLGQGGFGITYLAFDTNLNRTVAIKELFPEGSSRQSSLVLPSPSLGLQGFLETKSRFLAEAQALAQFSHVGIVRVFDVFEQNATAYLVMESLHGETLGQRLTGGALPPFTVKHLGLRLCEALDVVHSAGLLHRDIKPDNIFLASDRVVLLDFGSARAFAVDAVQSHTRLVTPGYAAPEQYASQAKFAAYTDIYGLAATLYHALEGVVPPSATDRMLGSSLRVSQSTPVANAIVQGMDIVAAKRPASAKAFAVLLEKNEDTVPVVPPKPVQSVSSNPAIRQVVNPVPLVRPTLAQVAASVSSRPSLSTVANQPSIFKPTPLPQKKIVSVPKQDWSWLVDRLIAVLILLVVWGLFSIFSQKPTNNNTIREYSLEIYSEFQSLQPDQKLQAIIKTGGSCNNKLSVTLDGKEITWNPPDNVSTCTISITNNQVRVEVRSNNGFVSVNGY